MTTISGPSEQKQDRYRVLQIALFTAGAVLMPSGVIAVGLGWWGAANARYAYDQFPYLLSGGLLGVCLTTLGGFLYFGAWQAKVASDQKQGMKHLSDAVLAMTAAVSAYPAAAAAAGQHAAGPVSAADLVVAGDNGAAVHRRDCGLIANREDLRVVTPEAVGSESGLTVCRVCSPAV